MYVNAWPIGNGITRRYSLVGIGMALLKCVNVEAGFEVSSAQATPSVVQNILLLPADQDVELPVPSPAPCLGA